MFLHSHISWNCSYQFAPCRILLGLEKKKKKKDITKVKNEFNVLKNKQTKMQQSNQTILTTLVKCPLL